MEMVDTDLRHRARIDDAFEIRRVLQAADRIPRPQRVVARYRSSGPRLVSAGPEHVPRQRYVRKALGPDQCFLDRAARLRQDEFVHVYERHPAEIGSEIEDGVGEGEHLAVEL